MTSSAAAPGTALLHDVLAREEARERAARVGPLDYHVELDLEAGRETYRGEARLRFSLAGSGDLFLDFRGGTIELLEINGRALEAAERPGCRIVLPAAMLGPEVDVRIVYENAFDRNGDGFHRFIDPVDGAEYCYSNFEPFEAHRLFPCFDQPDLKGRFTFVVTVPAEWAVISNSPTASIDQGPDGRRVHRFAPTPPLATYLAAVVAGPYVGVLDDSGPVPLGVWSRRSLAEHVDAAEVIAVTRQGMAFFAELFDRPFPFAKYDQLFVPEFNAGAMENAGAVTFAEAYVHRDPPTESQRLTRAETILHELAHMWFGDLVTMRWWDDLWLNESFATYVSNLALAEATRFEGAWRAFHADMKRWGYQADERSTTHPISGPVPDTDATFYNFDGITYGKGAAVLKQLVAALGRDAFRAGLRVYFDRHAWGNASLGDFLAALEEGSGRPLADWASRWLESASLNTIEARWTVRDGRVERLELTQEAPDAHPTQRPHALELALVRGLPDGGAIVDAIPARIDGAESWVEAAVGRPAPDLVFPNHGDHGYAKVRLDPASLAAAPSFLGRIDDPLLRQLLWATLWEMVRDAQLPASRYLALVRDRLPEERDDEIVVGALAAARAALARYVPEESRVPEAAAFARAGFAALGDLPPGDLRRLWLRAVIDSAAGPADVGALLAALDDPASLPAVAIDQEMRWGIVAAASAFGLTGAPDRIAGELRRDATDRGERFALLAATAAPDAPAKEAAWERIHGSGYGSLHRTRAAMRGFNQANQRDLLEPYVERFFEALPTVARTREHEFVRAYVGALFPSYRVEGATARRARDLVLLEGDSLPTLGRLLTEAADDVDRAVAARAFAAGAAAEA